MKKIVVSLLLATGVVINVQAQDDTKIYNNAVGIRLGPSVPVIKSGISYKRFLSNNNAIEGILSFGDGIGICGLYEIHKPLAAENVQWFIGFGGYVGFQNNISSIGGAGIAGIDYNFTNIPLNLTLDWKPELNIIEKIGFEGSTVGFSIRYRF